MVDTPVAKLGMADRQLVEISRTLARGGRIIAFDEPTSSLTPQERDGLFEVIRGLRAAGKAIIYISHRMEEIHAIADRFTVMRDGKVVATDAIEGYADAQLNELIAGRELSLAMEGRPPPFKDARSLSPPRAAEPLDGTLERDQSVGSCAARSWAWRASLVLADLPSCEPYSAWMSGPEATSLSAEPHGRQ